MKLKSVLVSIGIAGLLLTPGSFQAAQKKAKADARPARETAAKPTPQREKEMEGPYLKWAIEDVLYIITFEEREAFKRLSTDYEKENFIEQFWLLRNPMPDTVGNEFKEEHYRRIVYANERYASRLPGWKTDRGRIYITYGPPDEIEPNFSGGNNETTSAFPFEKWRYRYIEDNSIANDIVIEFGDPAMTGEFRMTMGPSEKVDRFSRGRGTQLGTGVSPPTQRMNQFERLERFANRQKRSAIKFKDLEASINSNIKFNLLPINVRADFLKITSSTIQANITLQFERKDLQFQQKDGISKAAVNLYARITAMPRRIVNVFEDVVSIDVPAELLEAATKGASIYQKSVPLAPGHYRLNVVVKDVIGGNMNNYEMALNVPRYEDEKLAHSSIIVADLIEKVSATNIGNGQFVIGASKVRPRLSESFRRDEKLGIFFKIYNFEPDEKTNKPNAAIDYEVVKTATNEKIFEFSDELNGAASATEVTIEKLLPLSTLQPGQYTLKMKVTDRKRNQTLTPAVTFTVT